jgi:hypothetical protein
LERGRLPMAAKCGMLQRRVEEENLPMGTLNKKRLQLQSCAQENSK